MRFAVSVVLAVFCAFACAQDLEREERLAQETLATLVVGDPIRLDQKGGHRFLGLYTRAANERGAVVIAHGRGWSPDYDLYGELRTRLADVGYSTLAIQMPVLPGSAKIGDHLTVRLPSGQERQGTVFYRSVDAGFATQRDVSRTKRDVKTFEVRLRVDNADRKLAVGMTAYVMLPVQ